ncbi:MAG: response regulator transcription factor [Bacteroidetes bacterium]|nr:MAG: response regulator transcription factor [Bacteroidota bacterium]
MNAKINLAIVDDHLLFRQGLRLLLTERDEFNILGDWSNGQEFLSALENGNMEEVEVVLLDIQMPIMDGFETLVKLKRSYPKIKVLMLTMDIREEQVRQLIELGCSGILVKQQEIDTIVEAVLGTYENDYYFNEHVSCELVRDMIHSGRLRGQFKNAELSPREIEIIKLICKEHTNREISAKLNISTRTVEGHRERILLKTNAKNVVGIVMYAMKNRLLSVQ